MTDTKLVGKIGSGNGNFGTEADGGGGGGYTGNGGNDTPGTIIICWVE